MKKNTSKTNKPIMFDRYPAKIKCTFRKNELHAEDFVIISSGDYTYYGEYEEPGCKVVYSLRVNGKYPNRLFKADYPPEISVIGSTELWGIRVAANLPEKTLKLDDPQKIRTETVTFSNKDVSIQATFEIEHSRLIEARKQKLKNKH